MMKVYPSLYCHNPTPLGGPADDAIWFSNWLQEYRHDFRVGKENLHNLKYAVFGLGNSEYDPKYFCTFAKSVDRNLAALGAKRLALGLGNSLYF